MDYAGGICRCCYSHEGSEMLRSPELDAYKFICDLQNPESEQTRITTCLRCREYLKEFHHFRIKCRTIDRIFRQNLDVKPHEIEMILKNAIDDKSDMDEVNKIDIEINKIEADSEPEESENLTSINSENELLIEYNRRSDELNAREESLHTTIDKHNSKVSKSLCKRHRHALLAEMILECNSCAVKSTDNLNAYRVIHTETGFNETYDNTSDSSLSCEHCSYHTRHKRNLIIHMRSHMKDCDKPYKCSECSFSTITLSSLEIHVASNHYDAEPFSWEQYSAENEAMRSVQPKEKRKRKPISLEKKFQILERLKSGEKVSNLAKEFDLGSSTISGILVNEDKIRERISIASSVASLNQTIRAHNILLAKTENCLIEWIEDRHRNNIPLDASLIKRKALKLFESFKEKEPDSKEKFVASNGWFERFKKRFSLNQSNYKTQETQEVETDSEVTLSCAHCDYRTRKKRDLIIHMNYHTENCAMLYKCSECSFSTINMSNLETHIASDHNEVKPFSWEQCSTKNTAIWSGKPKKKQKRMTISLERKLEIIQRIKCGEKIHQLAKEFNMKSSTISGIQIMEDKIRERISIASSADLNQTTRVKNILLAKTESCLIPWIEDCHRNNLKLDSYQIKKKALQLFKSLKEKIPDSKETFVASNGWFERFKKRCPLNNFKYKSKVIPPM